MKINESNIMDITTDNLYDTKIELANKILVNIQPLFDEVRSEKETKLEEVQKNFKDVKQQVNLNKTVIEQKLQLYNKKKKIHKLIERVTKLISLGLIHDPSMKKEMIILLKVAETLDDEKLENNLRRTLNILSKRFTTG